MLSDEPGDDPEDVADDARGLLLPSRLLVPRGVLGSPPRGVSGSVARTAEMAQCKRGADVRKSRETFSSAPPVRLRFDMLMHGSVTSAALAPAASSAASSGRSGSRSTADGEREHRSHASTCASTRMGAPAALANALHALSSSAGGS